MIPTLQVNGINYTSTEEMAQTYRYITGQTQEMSDANAKSIVRRSYKNVSSQNPETPAEAQTSPREIREIINRMRPLKAPGDDDIQPKQLKNPTKKLLVQLYYIYRECLKTQIFPSIWKNAKIIPIRKPGKMVRTLLHTSRFHFFQL